MAIRKGLHKPPDETGDGDGKKGRLPSLSIGNRTGEESSCHSSRLHRGNKVSGKIGHSTGWLRVEAEFPIDGTNGSVHESAKAILPELRDIPLEVRHHYDTTNNSRVHSK